MNKITPKNSTDRFTFGWALDVPNDETGKKDETTSQNDMTK